MKRTKVGITLMVAGLIMLAAGFIPLTRKIVVTEEKVMETTEYTEEVRTREEPYTEEVLIGTEPQEEILLRDAIPVVRASTLGKTFELKEGDKILFKAHSDDTMLISFTGKGEIYMSLEKGTDIEKEFIIEEDGEHSLLYSSGSVADDIVISFDIVRVYLSPITETVEKTRTVEYTEQVPYTELVPYTERTAKDEKYSVSYLRYIGAIAAGAGLVLYVRESTKKQSQKKVKKRKKK